MEITAQAKSVRISTRKVRIVADSIRNKSIDEALKTLQIVKKRASQTIEKTLLSAIANAVNNAKLERANLLIKSVDVQEGQSLKRFHPSTRGRVHPYKKRSSHITIVLTEKERKNNS